MPDNHLGYGLPIGGVLGTYNSVIPYGVGVDIACRMMCTITDLPAAMLKDVFAPMVDPLIRAITGGTVFGVGGAQKERLDHAVMDMDWNVTKVTRDLKDKACAAAWHVGQRQSLRRVRHRDADGAGARPAGGRVRRAAFAQRQPRHGRGGLQDLQRHRHGPAAKELRAFKQSGVAGPGQRGRPGVLGGDEPDGRIRRGQPSHDPRSRAEAGGGGVAGRDREPPQFRLEGSPRRQGGDRPPQGCDAGGRGRAGRHSGLDGRPGVRRARQGEGRERCVRRRTAPVAA